MTRRCFSSQLVVPVSAKDAFAWHEREGAMDRLVPPWEDVRVVDRGEGLRVGSRVVLESRLGPVSVRWVAEHVDYAAGRRFVDVQRFGPFKHWTHTHQFEDAASGSVIRDEVEYELPAGRLGDWIGSRYVRTWLDRLFAYRHRRVAADLSRLSKHGGTMSGTVAVTGASGLVGRELVPLLTTRGDTVVRLVRRAAGEGEVAWSPLADRFDASPLEGVTAVVHLAGENIASGRWTARRKGAIRESRVSGTRVLCEGLARMKQPPQVLLAASAIGFYGDCGDAVLDESCGAGKGFLSEVAREWEEATRPASEAGIRVVLMRLGVVLSPRGGALAKMLLPFRCGLGGKVGRGDQYWSWVAIDDVGEAIVHALRAAWLSGPVNVVAPDAVTNREFVSTLGRVLSRPALLPLPAGMARLLLGEMAGPLLLASTRVVPKRLLESGFEFRHPELESALRHLLGR